MAMSVFVMEKRIMIYPKDVVKITGRSNTWSCQKIRQAKEFFNLTTDDLLTVKQFCQFMKWNEEDITKFIK